MFTRDDWFVTYKRMFGIRFAEEMIRKYYQENKMRCPMHMSYGQEAAAVGVLHALRGRAITFSSYRSHAAYLANTGNYNGFFRELFGAKTGPNEGRAGSMHIASGDHWLSSGIVGAQIPIAVGAAYAFKYEKQGKDNRIAVVFFGDGATNEGVYYESVQIAALYQVPVLFVCEDNKLAVNTKPEERTKNGVLYRANDLMLSTQVCGASVEDVTEEARILVECMDRHSVPAFLRITCCRYLEHCGVEDDTDKEYRAEGRVAAWKESDPVKVAREKVCETCGEIEAIEREIRVKISKAYSHAEKAPKADPLSVMEGVYHVS